MKGKHVAVIALCALLLIAATVGVVLLMVKQDNRDSGGFRTERQERPIPVSTRRPAKTSTLYNIKIHARINWRKNNGKKWDFGWKKAARPDPKGYAKIGRKKLYLWKKNNTHSATWRAYASSSERTKRRWQVRFDGTPIRGSIKLYDIDATKGNEDFIGRCDFTIRGRVTKPQECGQAKVTITLTPAVKNVSY